ncbi:MAG TPA: AMP-binding protein [Syntrophales bacterium]|nr:AMP-binding protein [Syntrophales bacterium]
MAWKSLSQTWHYVEKWAAERPGAEAVVFEESRLTWADLKKETDKVALSLLEIGVEKGDRVAFLAMARPEFLTSYMAAGKVGAVWMGMNPKFTMDELRYQIGDSRPKVLIALRRFLDNDLGEGIRALAGEFPFIRKILILGDPIAGAESFLDFTGKARDHLLPELDRRAASVSGNDEALLMYTSGSTGKPKGVVHTHRSIVENIKVEVQKFYIHPGSRVLLHFPVNHVAADVEIGFGSIMAGACLVCMDKFDPVETLRMIQKEKLTFLGQLPVMFLLEMQQPLFKETDMSSIEVFAWAGAKAPEVLVRALAAICSRTGARMITGYGSTEVCGFVTYTEPGDSLDTLILTAGKAPPPFELKIVDEDGNELPDGNVGEIAVRGPILFKGYLNKPEETAKVMDKDGWYLTGDLACRDGRGYICITDRKTDMYKTGGENVYPREIEDILESHAGVVFAAVVAAPDDIFQEVGWAFIMQKPGQEISEEGLREYCKTRLANFKVPKRFFIRPLLPLLPTGKVNKMALKQEVKAMTGRS